MSFRCPACHAFVSIQPYVDLLTNVIQCRCCDARINVPAVYGLPTLGSALVAGTRRAETNTPHRLARGETCQNGPKGNAQYQSTLMPNGKIKKVKQREIPETFQIQLVFAGV